jgi:hypothetical protein
MICACAEAQHCAALTRRHETPVLSKPIEVVHLSEELVVLDKPCSLPVSNTCVQT